MYYLFENQLCVCVVCIQNQYFQALVQVQAPVLTLPTLNKQHWISKKVLKERKIRTFLGVAKVPQYGLVSETNTFYSITLCWGRFKMECNKCYTFFIFYHFWRLPFTNRWIILFIIQPNSYQQKARTLPGILVNITSVHGFLTTTCTLRSSQKLLKSSFWWMTNRMIICHLNSQLK